jgi:hypothetical protein
MLTHMHYVYTLLPQGYPAGPGAKRQGVGLC